LRKSSLEISKIPKFQAIRFIYADFHLKLPLLSLDYTASGLISAFRTAQSSQGTKKEL
jgi:hypothetical protein